MGSMEGPFDAMLRRGREIASERRGIEGAAANAIKYLVGQIPDLREERHTEALGTMVRSLLTDTSPDVPSRLIESTLVHHVGSYIRKQQVEDPESAISAFSRAFEENLRRDD